jgi:hypothetical protein
LGLLLDAYHYALDAGVQPEEFAVELPLLREFGMAAIDLRWLVRKGYVSHLTEVWPPIPAGRRFHPGAAAAFDDRSCFVLTPGGVAFTGGFEAPASGPGSLVPVWDSSRRELRWAAVVIKRFRVPAPNQELILASFEEEGWPAHIHDPLPHAAGVEPKRRLHDTIVALNRHQSGPAIRFFGDGTGAGLLWRPADTSTTPPPRLQ